MPLLLILKRGVGVGELGGEDRFALDEPDNIGSGRLMLAPRFCERSTDVGDFSFEGSAGGAFLPDLLLQRLAFGCLLGGDHALTCRSSIGFQKCRLSGVKFLPGCTQACLQLAVLGSRGRHCRLVELLRSGTRAQRRGERVFDFAAFLCCLLLARVERGFSVREPALENAQRSGRRVQLHRQFGFAPRKPFGVRDR